MDRRHPLAYHPAAKHAHSNIQPHGLSPGRRGREEGREGGREGKSGRERTTEREREREREREIERELCVRVIEREREFVCVI
jgi:hypothetical protein